MPIGIGMPIPFLIFGVFIIMQSASAEMQKPNGSLGTLPISGFKENEPIATATEELTDSQYGPAWFDNKRLGNLSKDFKEKVKPTEYREFSGAFNLIEPIFRRLRLFFGEDSTFMVTKDEIKGPETLMLLQLDLSKIPTKYSTKLNEALKDVTTATFILKDFWREVFFDGTNRFRVRMIANLQGTQPKFGNYRNWDRFFVKASDSKAVVLSLGGDSERFDRVIYRKKDGKASVVEDFDSSGKLVRREVMEVLEDGRTKDHYLAAFRQDITGDKEKLPDAKAAKRSYCLACHTVSLKALGTPQSSALFDLAHLNPNTYSNLNNYHTTPPAGHILQKMPAALSKQLPMIKPLN